LLLTEKSAQSYVQDMADTSTRPLTLARLEVCLEVNLDPADEEAVRWAVERAAERAAADAGTEVLRAVVTVHAI
jgi:hypothetical protein